MTSVVLTIILMIISAILIIKTLAIVRKENHQTDILFKKVNQIPNSANLYEVDLRGVDLRVADLRGADLRGADLRGAGCCWGADLRGP